MPSIVARMPRLPLVGAHPARQNGEDPLEVDVDIETVIWSILGVIVAVGGVLLLAALWSIVRAPRQR
jgi:hypothetical protein